MSLITNHKSFFAQYIHPSEHHLNNPPENRHIFCSTQTEKSRKMEHKPSPLVVVLVLAILASNTQISDAQGGSSCVDSLSPCLNYLNSTREPPNSCCDPLKYVIESNPQCLCRMISTQGSFQAQLLGINISQVELLPERCGQRVNPIACLKGMLTLFSLIKLVVSHQLKLVTSYSNMIKTET